MSNKQENFREELYWKTQKQFESLIFTECCTGGINTGMTNDLMLQRCDTKGQSTAQRLNEVFDKQRFQNIALENNRGA